MLPRFKQTQIKPSASHRACLINLTNPPDMIDQKDFERLAPLACQWAKRQEAYILEQGVPLNPKQTADARRAGVTQPERVRVLVVDRIPLPDDKELAEAARHAQIITDSSGGVAVRS